MKYDVLIVGVGGQGIILVSDIISAAAAKQGLEVKKSETHGMAQRGGSVVTHVRLSDKRIESPLIPKGGADMLLAFEPLEALRYLDYLKEDTKVIVGKNPVKVANYPPEEEVLAAVRRQGKAVLVDAAKLAAEAGHPLTQNTVLLGVASKELPIKKEIIEETLKAKLKKAVEENFRAFRLGAEQS